jgi:hypothetical protein
MANEPGYKRACGYACLSRAAKDPFADLPQETVKTIKSYLLPYKCKCRRMWRLKPRLSAYGRLARAAKDPFADLEPDVVKTIKSYLLPTKCGCQRYNHYLCDAMKLHCSPRPRMCKGMNAQDLRLWAKDNNRDDMLLHANCVEACEREDALRAKHRQDLKEGYDYLDKYGHIRGRVPDWLQDEINHTVFSVGHCVWDDGTDEHEMLFRVDLFKEAEELIEQGNEAAAKDLFIDEASDLDYARDLFDDSH